MLICPKCGNKAMSWLKKIFGLRLRCNSCGERLHHDVLWSLLTLIVFTLVGYYLIRYFFAAWSIIPVLVAASLVILVTPLRRETSSK